MTPQRGKEPHVTETTTVTADADTGAPPTTPARKGGGLSGMVLAELQQVASGLGIKGTARMRKGQLIEAIQTAQAPSRGTGGPASNGSPTAAAPAGTGVAETADPAPTNGSAANQQPFTPVAPDAAPVQQDDRATGSENREPQRDNRESQQRQSGRDNGRQGQQHSNSGGQSQGQSQGHSQGRDPRPDDDPSGRRSRRRGGFSLHDRPLR